MAWVVGGEARNRLLLDLTDLKTPFNISPQAFRDVAASAAWEDGGQVLIMRAACQLPAGLLLSGTALLVGCDGDGLLLTEGAEALATLARMASGAHKGV